MTTSTTSKRHVATQAGAQAGAKDGTEGGGEGESERSRDGRARGGRSPGRPSKVRAFLAGALLVVVGGAPALAIPSPAAAPSTDAPGVDLRLDGRAAGRLLAQAKEPDPASGGDDKSKSDEKPGDKGDEGVKMTVTKGAPPAAKSTGSDDTFAFVKDWPFWAIVGGVVIVGASVYMINRNSNQDRSCPSTSNLGCFGAK